MKEVDKISRLGDKWPAWMKSYPNAELGVSISGAASGSIISRPSETRKRPQVELRRIPEQGDWNWEVGAGRRTHRFFRGSTTLLMQKMK